MIVLAFVSACGQLSTQEIDSTQITTLIQPTETHTITPPTAPSHTPTIIPTATPLGGKNGLLFEARSYNKETSGWDYGRIFSYNLPSSKMTLIFEGYVITGVSGDGKNFILEKQKSTTSDLFIVDLSDINQITLLQENIEPRSSIWTPQSDWIGFVASVDGIPQVFVIHADGTSLIQVTNSIVGATEIGSLLNTGVFWAEGKIRGNTTETSAYMWTKFDGTETRLDGPGTIFEKSFMLESAGKYVFSSIIGATGTGCTRTLYNLETSEATELTLTQANPDMRCHDIWPLSDDTWLVVQLGTGTTNAQYWFYSSDGTLLKSFAELPLDHEALPNIDNINENSLFADYYRPISPVGGQIKGQQLSPDGNLLFVEHIKSDENLVEFSYYLLNLSTFEVQKLPSLLVTHDRKSNTFDGNFIYRYFWIEIP